MALVVDFSVPPDAFVLGRSFDVGINVAIELEEIVPTGEQVAPYFWVTGEVDDFEEAVRGDESVLEVAREFSVDDTALFRVRWNDNATELLEAIGAADGTILRGTGKDAEWTFTIRFPDNDSIVRFRSFCEDRSIPLDIQRLKYLSTRDLTGDFGLTEKQRDTLLAALERGYFDVPRATTQSALAESLDVSDSAVSELIRRGISRLVGSTLVAEGTERAERSGAPQSSRKRT